MVGWGICKNSSQCNLIKAIRPTYQNTMVRHLKYCQDPTKKHKKRITTNLRKVNDTFVEKCAGKVKKDSLLCVNLWKLIMKNPTILSATEKTDSESSSVSGLSNISAVEDQDSEHSLMEENPSSSVEPVLALLDQTPVKKSKYYSMIYFIFNQKSLFDLYDPENRI